MARQRMTPPILFMSLLMVMSSSARPQQMGDPDFSAKVDNPAYPSGKGPVVLIDEGHNNFHTAKGRYRPFADLLRKDGCRVYALSDKFTEESLQNANILVVANALHKRNLKSWRLPSPSAFTEKEIPALEKWVRDGGALLLIADHMPFPGAAKDLAATFGFAFNNGFAFAPDRDKQGTRFSRNDGSLKDHPITRGLTPDAKIDFVVTFTGQAFQGPPQAEPLLIFGKACYSLMPRRAWEFSEDTPKISVEGWFQGAVRRYGKGRIAVFGEAAAFTAQLSGPENVKTGMNSPQARQNYQFVLNVIHWLCGLMDSQ